MGKYTQFLLRIEPGMLKQIEMISLKGKISEKMREIFDDWLNINYPSEESINNKIEELESEIIKLQEFKNDINFITIKEQEKLKTTDQYRNKMIDSVMNMLSIQFIYNNGDDKFYQKWMKTLNFSTKPELLIYLDKKWEEYGTGGVLKHIHRSEFIKLRIKSIELKAQLEKIEYEEFLKTHNIDLYNEYDVGKLQGSSKDFEEYMNKKLNK